MRPFTTLHSVAAPLLRANIDTDAIIPSREMRTVSKSGLAEGLFAGWRYTSIGGRDPNREFVLNQPAYKNAQILLAGENFGCGSSREHAVWALAEYGFRAVIAPSFNPIFENNCIRNGVLPIQMPLVEIEKLQAASSDASLVSIDLEQQTVTAADGRNWPFPISAPNKEMLLYGLDPIELTLRAADEINAFVQRDRLRRPWAHLA